MIAIGGIPGSGKTSLAHAVAAGLNKKAAQQALPNADAGPATATDTDGPPGPGPLALAVPMDGFHLTRAQLSAMPDPALAHARRGAEFTFDGDAFVALVAKLRAPVQARAAPIRCPSFDHAVKDPVPDTIAIGPGQRIVLFEGNYLCLDKAPWNRASRPDSMDERWFVEVDFAVARARLIRRHVAAGIAANEAEAAARADENDLVNGAQIVASKVPGIDETIVSKEDASW